MKNIKLSPKIVQQTSIIDIERDFEDELGQMQKRGRNIARMVYNSSKL